MAEIRIIGNVTSFNRVNRFKLNDVTLVGIETLPTTFNPDVDYIEYSIYDIANNLLNITYDYTDYKNPQNKGLNPGGTYSYLEINPEEDVQSYYNIGEFVTQYNFFQSKIGTPQSADLFIKEISPDRTELRVSTLTLTTAELATQVNNLINNKNVNPYLSPYLLNFRNNNNLLITNIALDTTNPDEYYVLFKLYEPLPINIVEKDRFWVVEEISNSLRFNLSIQNQIIPDPLPNLKGPNFDVDINIKKNTLPTQYESYSTLLQFTGSSLHTILNHLDQTSIDINVDYTDFTNFSRFGSAQKRVENFYSKIKQIEVYNTFIKANSAGTSTVTGLQTQLSSYSASINNIISKFDGYESYLYFQTGSNTYPHLNSTVPYLQYPSTSSVAIDWYNTQLDAAINYDINNQDNLVFLIPEYIRIDLNNTPYLTFVNMIGQYFDNIYIYLKSVTDLYKNYNNLEEGVSKDLVYYALQDLGVDIHNSSEDDDLNTYSVAVSGSNIPSKDLVAELYKRIYHNIPLLFKGKGSRRGMQELITTFGITGSILGIKEYGGNSNTHAALVDYSNSKVRVINEHIYSGSGTYGNPTGTVLSPNIKLASTNVYTNYKNDSDRVDISFSPYNQIDTTISASIATSYPSFSIDDYIGDPRNASQNEYGNLNNIRYQAISSSFTYKYDINGFIQLIKFFDNTLFKMLKSYVPAKANLNEGITIRQQALERIKFKRNEPNVTQQTVYDAEYNAPEITEDTTYLYSDLAGNKAAFYTGDITGSYINIGEDYAVQENPYLFPIGNINQNTFNHTDYNVLLNNVSSSRLSSDRLKVEVQPYSPINLLTPVELQDSYESLTSYQLSRHDGVKLTAQSYNVFTSGDVSWGRNPVIGKYSTKLGLFTSAETSSIFSRTTNLALKYLVDIDGNLTELNQNNTNWVDVQNLFKSKNNATLALFDPIKYGNQKPTNGLKMVRESGWSYEPYYYNYFSQSVECFTSTLTSVGGSNVAYRSGAGWMFAVPQNNQFFNLGLTDFPLVFSGSRYILQQPYAFKDYDDGNNVNSYVDGFRTYPQSSSFIYGIYYQAPADGYYKIDHTVNVYDYRPTGRTNYKWYSKLVLGATGSDNLPSGSVIGTEVFVNTGTTNPYSPGATLITLENTQYSYLSAGQKVFPMISTDLSFSELNSPRWNGSFYTSFFYAGNNGFKVTNLGEQGTYCTINTNLFSSSQSPNYVAISSSYVGNFQNYLYYTPSYDSASATSPLYSTYGDVNYPMNIDIGDTIVFNYTGSGAPLNSYAPYSFIITSTGSDAGGNLLLYTLEPIPQFIYNNINSYVSVLFLKRRKDETNVSFNFTKKPGLTSYGFVIPNDISPEILKNIDTITKQVKQKLLADQQGTTSSP
jgi:hypothetical protein